MWLAVVRPLHASRVHQQLAARQLDDHRLRRADGRALRRDPPVATTVVADRTPAAHRAIEPVGRARLGCGERAPVAWHEQPTAPQLDARARRDLVPGGKVICSPPPSNSLLR